MKKALSQTLLAIALGASAQVFAQSNPPVALSPAQGKEDFATHKAKIVQNLKDHLACVEAAQNKEDLRKCRPSHPPHDQMH